MHHSKFHFLSFQNSKRNQEKQKILNLHDGLLSYQPTSTANSAHQGWIGCAGWLVAQRRNVIGFQTNVFLNPYGMSFHAVAIFSLEVTTLLDSSWAHCDYLHVKALPTCELWVLPSCRLVKALPMCDLCMFLDFEVTSMYLENFFRKLRNATINFFKK